MRNLIFTGFLWIDIDVMYLFVMFEHRCHMHCFNTSVVCLFILFTRESHAHDFHV
jgi:hypothetical protein